MPRTITRSPRRNERNLRVRLKEVEPHSNASRQNQEGSRQNKAEDMLTRIHFIEPEAEEEVEEE